MDAPECAVFGLSGKARSVANERGGAGPARISRDLAAVFWRLSPSLRSFIRSNAARQPENRAIGRVAGSPNG